jgi:small subunit ribosomal protein S1
MEGLVRITEMSWTRRINHPSELVQIGDVVEVQVLAVNKNRQEITLGMNQVLPKPGTR